MIMGIFGSDLGPSKNSGHYLGRSLWVFILTIALVMPSVLFCTEEHAFADTATTAAATTTTTTAATTSTGGEVGYSVYADIPDNQIDKSSSYFDLRMRPGAVQDLRVIVTNETDAPIKVTVAAISASTNRNGIIDYRTPNIKDITLAIPFSEISTVSEPIVTVPANSSYPAIVTVRMPSNSYDGVVLGGIVITREGDAPAPTETDGTANIQVENVYSYVVGVKLSESDVVLKPDFEYVDNVPTLINYQPAVVLTLRNKVAVIVKDMKLEARIYKLGEQEPLKTIEQNVDMAPNSVLPLSVMMDTQLTAGDYYVKVDLGYDDSSWQFESNFSITGEQAADLDSNAVSTTENLPWWALLLIVFGAIAGVACLILIILLLKKRRKEEEEEYDEEE